MSANLHKDLVPQRRYNHTRICTHTSWGQQRGRRIGQFVRQLCHGLFVVPIRALTTGTRLGGRLAVECLPELTREPAVRKIGKLTAEKEFAAAQAAFDQEVSASTAAMPSPTSSPSDLPRADASGALARKQA